MSRWIYTVHPGYFLLMIYIDIVMTFFHCGAVMLTDTVNIFPVRVMGFVQHLLPSNTFSV